MNEDLQYENVSYLLLLHFIFGQNTLFSNLFFNTTINLLPSQPKHEVLHSYWKNNKKKTKKARLKQLKATMQKGKLILAYVYRPQNTDEELDIDTSFYGLKRVIKSLTLKQNSVPINTSN